MIKRVVCFILIITSLLSCTAFGMSAGESAVSDEGRLPFEDVKDSYWYYDGATFCYANSIVNGMNSYTFAPAGKLTRAQFVTMLANLEGVDTSKYSVSQFYDVKAGYWYYGAVAWAYSMGIVSGTSEHIFNGSLELNRQTLSRMMMLYMRSKGYEVELKEDSLASYTDKDTIASWAVEGMEYAVSAGLIQGMTEDTVVPLGTVTRAQASRILMLFGIKYHYAVCDHFFVEATCTESEHCAYCGMKIGLPIGHTVAASYNCKTSAICTVCSERVLPSKYIHNFAPATCAVARKCRDCGILRGEPTQKHTWKPATCTENAKCLVCNISGAPYLGHSVTGQPTCTTGVKCNRCGIVTQKALGHNYKSATCTNPKICKRCNAKSGAPLGHNIVNELCTRCNFTTMTDARKKTVHYLSKVGYVTTINGKPIGKGRFGGIKNLGNGDHLMSNVCYEYNSERVVFEVDYMKEYGGGMALCLYVPKLSTSYEYWAVYRDANGDQVASAYGTLNAASIYNGMSFVPANFSGRNNLRSEFNTMFYQCLMQMMVGCDEILNEYCDCDIHDYGFKNF